MEWKLLDSRGYVASTYNSAWHTECPTQYVMTGLADELVDVTAARCHSLGMWTSAAGTAALHKEAKIHILILKLSALEYWLKNY